VCLRHADAPRCALFAAFEPLFRPLDEAPRRSRSRHFGSLRHTSSRSDPASFTYAPSSRSDPASFTYALVAPHFLAQRASFTYALKQKVVELVQFMVTCADAAIAAKEELDLSPEIADGGVIKNELHEDGVTLILKGGRFRVTVGLDASP
jgi:hypothetical protein